jgi:membrane fusion protein (multidrug efflux system)
LPIKEGAPAAEEPGMESVEKVDRREVPLVTELVARTEAVATVELRPSVEGRLLEAPFEEGRMVRRGQTLFRIDPRRYAAAVESARASVEKAEADLEMAREQENLARAEAKLRQAEADLLKANQDVERMKPLAARRAIPQRDLDAAVAAQSSAQAAAEEARAGVRTTKVSDRVGVRQAQANLEAAKAVLARAQVDLEETELRSPIGGLIGRLEISVGNYVGPGQPNLLAVVSQLDPIRLVFDVPESLYLRIEKAGADRAGLNRIELVLSDNSTYPHRGRLVMMGRAVDAKTGTLPVEAEFPNPQGKLLPGMFGRVRVAAETLPDAVLVSERALFDVQGSRAVYLVSPQNTVTLRSVATSGGYHGKSIVTSGLTGGETVIVEGLMKVRPGAVVAPQEAK